MARDDPRFYARLEEQFKKEMTTAYVGIDATADSLHIGHLVSIMLLRHFNWQGTNHCFGWRRYRNDWRPSGKSEERNLLSLETLRITRKVLKNSWKFLNFNR